MRRSDDMLRALLLELEEYHDPLYPFPSVSGMSPEDRIKHFHLRLLCDAGYLEESGRSGGMFRITNAGHDFLVLTRSNEAWSAVKMAASSLGGASVRMLGEIAYALAKDKLRQIGVPLG